MKSYSNSIAFLALVAAFLGLGVTFGQEEHGSKKAFIAYVRDYKYVNSLEGVDNDASKLADVLGSQMGFVNTRFSNTAADGKDDPNTSARDSFEKVFENWIKSIRKGDTVVVYLTGHGVLDDEGNVHYAFGNIEGRNGRATNLEYASYSMKTLRDKLENCHAKSKLLILDCCYAGATGDQKSPNAPRLAKSSEVVGVFDATSTITTLASSEGNEVSHMLPGKNHSVFTYWLLFGLRGYADNDLDGEITLDELFKYTSAHVSGQTPKLINRNDDISLTLNPASDLARSKEIAELLAEAVKRHNPKLKLGVPEFSHGDDANHISRDGGTFPKRIAQEITDHYKNFATEERTDLRVISYDYAMELLEGTEVGALDSKKTRVAVSKKLSAIADEEDSRQNVSVAFVNGNIQPVEGPVAKLEVTCVDLLEREEFATIRCLALLYANDLASLGTNVQTPSVIPSLSKIQRDTKNETDPDRIEALNKEKERAENRENLQEIYEVAMIADYREGVGEDPDSDAMDDIKKKAQESAIVASYLEPATDDAEEIENPLQNGEAYCKVSFKTRQFRKDRSTSDKEYNPTEDVVFKNGDANFYIESNSEFAIQIENNVPKDRPNGLLVSVLVDGRDTLLSSKEEENGGLGPRRDDYKQNGLWIVPGNNPLVIKGFTNYENGRYGSFVVRDLNTDTDGQSRTTYGDQTGVITVIVWKGDVPRGEAREVEVGNYGEVKIDSKVVKRGRLLAKYSIFYDNED